MRRKDSLVSSSELARENEQKVVHLIRAHFWTRRGIIKQGRARKCLGTHESEWVSYPGLIFLFTGYAGPQRLPPLKEDVYSWYFARGAKIAV